MLSKFVLGKLNELGIRVLKQYQDFSMLEVWGVFIVGGVFVRDIGIFEFYGMISLEGYQRNYIVVFRIV